MADLQARIGPKATKLYPNLTWKRPGADPQSPSKNIVKGSHTRQSDEKEDSDASSHERASSPIFSSPTKSRSNLPRPKESSRQPSLLSRMGLDSGVSEDDVLERKEAAVPQSLLPRVGTTEDTPRSSPNIRSTGDSVHVSDPNRCHGTTNSSPQPALPSSSVCLSLFFCNFRSNLLPKNRFLTIDTIVSRILIQIAVNRSTAMIWLSNSQQQGCPHKILFINPFCKIVRTSIILQAT